MFAQIWTGCKCPGGETWHVAIHEEVDINQDEIYQIPYCTVCLSDNIQEKKTGEGILCVHALTDEEMEADMFIDDEF
jgi:hypothetical protein